MPAAAQGRVTLDLVKAYNSNMVTISLCMIVKNEEALLGRCLASVRDVVDEIVIVDTGSSDGTKAIAEKFTQKIYDFEWIQDFSAARNYSFSKAECEYILWLDADDVVTANDAAKLLALKEKLQKTVNVVMLRYDVCFDNFDNVTLSYYRERIVKNAPANVWQDAVHEVIVPSGEILYSDIAIQHRKPLQEKTAFNPRNLNIYRKQIEDGKPFSPRQQFYYARELMYAELTEQAVAEFEKFLRHGKGWVENNIEACKNLSDCLSRLGKHNESFEALVKSFAYDNPRAEICCDLGKYFLFTLNRPSQAAYWYELAASIKPNAEQGCFCLYDCYGYIPNIQLCLCYDLLGDKDKAKAHNEIAAYYKPNDPSVLYNRRYFGLS